MSTDLSEIVGVLERIENSLKWYEKNSTAQVILEKLNEIEHRLGAVEQAVRAVENSVDHVVHTVRALEK